MSVAYRTWRKRKAMAQAEELSGPERFVDMGVDLHVVAQDEGVGFELYPGKPPVKVLRTHRFGGLLDTRARQFVGPSSDPVAWFCSEAQERLLLHPEDGPPKILVHGGMGAGKTELAAPWAILRSIEFCGYSGGCILATAPTGKRLRVLQRKIAARMPPEWGSWVEHHSVFRMATGVDIELRATKRYSKDGGSPVAGLDAFAAVSDEIQDHIFDPEVESEIDARGRSAPGGVYRRVATATAKSSSAWRDHLGVLKESPEWEVVHMLGPSNPFVWPQYWERLKHGRSEREYQRIMGFDVGPEKQVYSTFSRDTHLMPIPQVGARDVTSRVMRGYGSNIAAVVGHDPGSLQDVSLLLKAFEFAKPLRLKGVTIPAKAPVWFVVGELTTNGTTAEEHAAELLRWLQTEHSLEIGHHDDPGVLVIADPSSENEAKQSPHKSVYKAMRRVGLHRVVSAAPKGKRVPKEAGIEMVRGLFRDASNEARLFVAKLPNGRPAAPDLVRALEESERDEKGDAETQRKDVHDLSHWPAALRYGLYPMEKEGGPVKSQLAEARMAKEASN